MNIPDSLINPVVSRVLRGVMEESGLQQKTWAQKSGMSLTVVQKLLSGNQAVKLPQLLALAHASIFTPEEVMERIDRAVARAVSEAGSNVIEFRPQQSPKDGAQEDTHGQRHAANFDTEHEQDEPDTP
ncbi:helix-turn-helix domain-containing protein [Microbacterium telephonicum]|uniref:helix-turn-helix domain-containing protein n=1 Tax=Microbacterium telephonicum TaxID=1714841 RepID=UPI0011C40A16|nr:helix-turn-helix transcriptional regulator [Microbacterium telephonicum]